ncbi:carbonic anhydrase [Tissierella creatinini]|nr:carbonic anhydrase [Tissierella creatinini]TJX63810.1 carbonic anhydrase [Soehngenia saccharolytica]
MKDLLKGILNFREKDYYTHKELFNDLKEQQKPHTLFISCSDSRVDPNMITKSLPGELFIIRNIANIVPPFRKSEDYAATTSAIEYAVLVLGVDNIIICGHSNCGGCAACLMSEESLDNLPHTKKWLELSKSVRDRILEDKTVVDKGKREWMMEQANIVEQMRHLLTYPYIAEKVENKTLTISGWHYIIETGEVFIYDKVAGEFKLAN